MRRQEQYKEYLLESDNMGDQVNKRIILRWMLGTQVVRKGGDVTGSVMF
jgi:hypothetical protein